MTSSWLVCGCASWPDGPAKWANARLVRYADDFVIPARYQGDKLNDWITSKIETWMGLEINREKTRIVDLCQQGESLDFLGYTFRFDKDLRGGSHRYFYVAGESYAKKGQQNQCCYVPDHAA